MDDGRYQTRERLLSVLSAEKTGAQIAFDYVKSGERSPELEKLLVFARAFQDKINASNVYFGDTTFENIGFSHEGEPMLIDPYPFVENTAREGFLRKGLGYNYDIQLNFRKSFGLLVWKSAAEANDTTQLAVFGQRIKELLAEFKRRVPYVDQAAPGEFPRANPLDSQASLDQLKYPKSVRGLAGHGVAGPRHAVVA